MLCIDDYIKKNLEQSQLSISVKLGTTELNIKKILNLKKGDVILMNTKVNGKLSVAIEDEEKFLGYPGIIGKKKAVRITDITNE